MQHDNTHCSPASAGESSPADPAQGAVPGAAYLALAHDASGRADGALAPSSPSPDLAALQHRFDCAREPMAVVDGQRRVLRANLCLLALLGRPQGLTAADDFSALSGVPPEMFAAAASTGCWTEVVEPGESPLGLPLEITVLQAAPHFVVTMLDISERRIHEQRIQNLTMLDALTQLPNRLAMQVHTEQMLAQPSPVFGVLLVNLDGFREINDSYGHDSGDQLLHAVSGRLQALCADGTLLARLGSDEFVFVLPAGSGDTELRSLAQGVVAALFDRFEVGSDQISITPTLGAVLAPQDGDEVAVLLRKADAAVLASKVRGNSGLVFYDNSLEIDAQRRVRLTSLLREDTERNAFHFMAEPKVDVDGRPLGAEVLIRWQPEPFGVVAPVEFIPLAEKVGLIQMIGRHAIHAAAQLAAEIHRLGLHLPVAVNLSPKQMLQPGLDGQLLNACRRHNIAPKMLELELTESALIHNIDVVRPLLERLRRWGFTLALDDFGTGYSSLSYLRHLPFHKVKIDRSFVRDVDRDTSAARILQNIVQMCAALDMGTVAEGVETQQQWDVLRQLGVSEFQGYLFAPPLTTAQWAAMLGAQPEGALQLPQAVAGSAADPTPG